MPAEQQGTSFWEGASTCIYSRFSHAHTHPTATGSSNKSTGRPISPSSTQLALKVCLQLCKFAMDGRRFSSICLNNNEAPSKATFVTYAIRFFFYIPHQNCHCLVLDLCQRPKQRDLRATKGAQALLQQTDKQSSCSHAMHSG